jgi:sugar phosphate isomerase/epimerase
MIVGAMNHPAQDPVEEIRWMAEMRLDFVDLTIEPPGAASWRIDTKAVRQALDHYKMKVIGHTAYYLPLGSAFDALRRASVEEFKRCLEKFAEIGASWMNIHPDRHTPMHDRAFFIQRNIESLLEMQEHADKAGVGLMIENLPGEFNNANQLGELLDRYGNRLKHVHLHDNRGGNADLHLPLGAGDIDVPSAIRALKRCGFDGTITLEVFTRDRHYLAYSRDVLRTMWDRVAPPLRSSSPPVTVGV